MKDGSDQLAKVHRLCHQLCSASCVEEKARGCHELLLSSRPHWSVLKKEEQHCRIDQGEKVPFDISLPLPARDERPDSDRGGEALLGTVPLPAMRPVLLHPWRRPAAGER